jgi:hypothetical protein
MQYFASKGFPCPSLRNPSDHYLRTINKDFDAVCIYIDFSLFHSFFFKAITREKLTGGFGSLIRTSKRGLMAQQASKKSLTFSSSHTSHLGLSSRFCMWYLRYANRYIYIYIYIYTCSVINGLLKMKKKID